MAERRPPAPPPFEAVMLLTRHLEPTTLAISACVCRSWRAVISSDEVWLPLCAALSPSLSTHHPRPPSRRIFSLLLAARRRKMPSPPPPLISLDDILFAVDLLTPDGKEPAFAAVKAGSALNKSSIFRFELGGGEAAAPPVSELRSSWTVVGRGWKEAVVMMGGREKGVAVGENEVYFTEEIPSAAPPVGGGGMVAEMVVRFGGRGLGRRIVGVWVGVMRVGHWRYVDLDDVLRYLQHFLSPT